MSRLLHAVETQIGEADRAQYLAGLPARRARAASRQAHFWAFEHSAVRGRFLEFTEVKRAEDLAHLVDADAGGDHWQEVQEESSANTPHRD
jgi:hypothetical protein